MKSIITDANYLVFAAQHYDSPFPETIEFQEDLKRVVYIKRLFNTYVEKDDLKERLVINHLIVMFNMFGEAAAPMLFLKLEGYESILKTFLTFINRMPATLPPIGNPSRMINNSDISLDPQIWKRLITL